MLSNVPISFASLQFRRTAEEDLEFVLTTEQHPANTPFIISWTPEQHRETIHSSDKLHLLVETPDGRPVGYLILAGLTSPNRCIELVRITIADQGRGYGKASIRFVQNHAFKHLKAHRLWLDVKEHNARAKQLYESSGFKTEGTLRECIRTNGGYESLIVMSMLEREYEERGGE
ncbi:GNAT family N-acetyltransferase [Paenibacillus oleatilyticus]|uniref:GNAT family N-acetyltransferase n=1 Tax=Paenibacillus oleatilyticus TaxID=2594886 RepID=UPI001C1F8082|nr:GNAT family protein [Paenibacillus oleatilyticus]MBU7314715.1 GNAT family N-acetyltransferase [Paenibacillus oleatilyticus]